MNMIDRADQRSRREHANARNRLKPRGYWMRGGNLRELPIEDDDSWPRALGLRRPRAPRRGGALRANPLLHPQEWRPRAGALSGPRPVSTDRVPATIHA